MYLQNIRLQEAMTRDINKNVRVWELNGPHVNVKKIPKKAEIVKTFVMKRNGSKIRVGVEWIIPERLGSQMTQVAEFSTLEDLKEHFPHLFELDGDMCAFN